MDGTLDFPQLLWYKEMGQLRLIFDEVEVYTTQEAAESVTVVDKGAAILEKNCPDLFHTPPLHCESLTAFHTMPS